MIPLIQNGFLSQFYHGRCRPAASPPSPAEMRRRNGLRPPALQGLQKLFFLLRLLRLAGPRGRWKELGTWTTDVERHEVDLTTAWLMMVNGYGYGCDSLTVLIG